MKESQNIEKINFEHKVHVLENEVEIWKKKYKEIEKINIANLENAESKKY